MHWSTDSSGRASIKSAFIPLDVFFEPSVHHSTLSDPAWLQRVESTRQLLGVEVQNLLTRIVHVGCSRIRHAHWEMSLNNKTPRMLLWDHSQPTFRLIEGSEGRGGSGAWTAWWSLKREIWIITPRRGRMITKWDNGTPVIINDDKTRYNQLKSTLFHFLTEFKRIEPFLGSWSFSRFDRWPPFWPFRLVGHKFYSAPSCLREIEELLHWRRRKQHHQFCGKCQVYKLWTFCW